MVGVTNVTILMAHRYTREGSVRDQVAALFTHISLIDSMIMLIPEPGTINKINFIDEENVHLYDHIIPVCQ